MRKRGGIALSLAVLASAALASSAGAGSSATEASAVSCKGTFKIALMTPLTGDAGFLGQEQLSWSKLAVKRLAPALGLKVQLLQGDTQLDTALASSLAQKYVADKSVVAIIGPATSGAVAATSKTFFDAKMAHISPSATRVSLTKGNNKEGTPAFFRVVPDDSVQGPTVARFMVDKLKAKKVVLIDAREPYSVGLANVAEAVLKARGVTTIRESVSVEQSDFSSIVTKIPADTDIVFTPWQQPPKVQTFAQQLIEQGKRAKVFGGDGANDPDKFKVAGSFVSNFAPPLDQVVGNAALIAAWKADNPGATLGSFGPPAYGAVQVALEALKKACAKKSSVARADVLKQVKSVRVARWLLGGSFRFSTKTNDPLNKGFTIFEIQSNGSYKVVG